MTQHPQIVFEEKCEKHLQSSHQHRLCFYISRILLPLALLLFHMLKILLKLDVLLYSVITT